MRQLSVLHLNVYMTRLLLLLLPSISSGIITAGLALILFTATSWSYINENQLFYDVFFGVYGFKTVLLQAPDSFWTFQNAVLNSSVTYYVLLVLVGLIAGLTVYTVLEGIGRTMRSASRVMEEMHAEGAAYERAVHESYIRLILRIVSLASWALYTVCFVSLIMPFCIFLIQLGVDDLATGVWMWWIRLLAALAIICVALHVHIVFARLCMLRPRLFGDTDIETATASIMAERSEELHGKGSDKK